MGKKTTYVYFGYFWVRGFSASGQAVSIQEEGPGLIHWVPENVLMDYEIGQWCELQVADWFLPKFYEGLRVKDEEREKERLKRAKWLEVLLLGMVPIEKTEGKPERAQEQLPVPIKSKCLPAQISLWPSE